MLLNGHISINSALSSQADEFHKGSWRTNGLQVPSTCHLCCQGAKRKISSAEGGVKERPKNRAVRLLAKPASVKVE